MTMGRPAYRGQEGRPAGQVERADDGVQDPALPAQIEAPFGRLDEHGQAQGRQAFDDDRPDDEQEAAEHGDRGGRHQDLEDPLFERPAAAGPHSDLRSTRTRMMRAAMLKTRTTPKRTSAASIRAES